MSKQRGQFVAKLLTIALVPLVFASILIGCQFRVEEYPVPNPPTGIVVMANDVPLVDSFLFFNPQAGNGTRTLQAIVTSGESNEAMTGIAVNWEVVQGYDNVRLLQASGESVAIEALKAGDARIRVTAENSFGKLEEFIDVLVGNEQDGSADWIFRVFENRQDGLTEILDGDELFILFNEERLIEVRAVGTTKSINFTLESNVPSVAIHEVMPGSFLISGASRQNVEFTVTATEAGLSPPPPLYQTF